MINTWSRGSSLLVDFHNGRHQRDGFHHEKKRIDLEHLLYYFGMKKEQSAPSVCLFKRGCAQRINVSNAYHSMHGKNWLSTSYVCTTTIPYREEAAKKHFTHEYIFCCKMQRFYL